MKYEVSFLKAGNFMLNNGGLKSEKPNMQQEQFYQNQITLRSTRISLLILTDLECTVSDPNNTARLL